MTPPPSQGSSSQQFYNSPMGSVMFPILSSSFHSLIFPLSSSITSWTTVSLPFLVSSFFHRLQFLSNLCQYCLSYSPSDHPYNLLAVYRPGNSPLLYSLSSSSFSCHLTSWLFLLYSSSNFLSKSPVFFRFFQLSHVSPSAMKPFHQTRYLFFPRTFLLFSIFSTSHSSSPLITTGCGISIFCPSTWLVYLRILLVVRLTSGDRN